MKAPWGRRPIDAALVYAHRGWEVFPCHTPAHTPGSCTCCRADCSSPGKHPRIRSGLHEAARDEAVIRRWWANWPDANVAIRTGAASGLVVIDIDPDHGGNETLQRVLDERGPLPACRTVRTGSGGRHFYFAHPGFDVPNDTGRRLGPGIDIRGDGGYVIAPPSLHVSGGRYAVAAHGGQIVPPPGWLAELLKRPEPEPHPTRTRAAVSVEHGDAWARAAMHGELQRLHDATPGIRNSTLNRVSFRLGQIIGAGLLDHREIEQSLIQAGVSVGLGEREVARTVESGLTAGMEAPRGPVERVDLEIDGGPSLG